MQIFSETFFEAVLRMMRLKQTSENLQQNILLSLNFLVKVFALSTIFATDNCQMSFKALLTLISVFQSNFFLENKVLVTN